MNKNQKSQIIALRKQGSSLMEVADKLGLPIGTVKSFWRRHCTSMPAPQPEVPKYPEAPQQPERPVETVQLDGNRCKQCGIPLKQTPHHRSKLFCSDKCRLSWWHDNRQLAKGAEQRTCPACGATFTAGGTRKYCSHSCYIKARYA